ncbi:hypothetical protein BOTCAL_0254g00130 [Botryotinia calthae]|uniref:Uncharacterized protein n=1 Tax=Botryotinia calthae TaxID=38488 RepID=A0A4Y8CWE3_9HELO|nr:hypothetical protein BOTCAL_0254g00130 [Botryotinia calthae]
MTSRPSPYDNPPDNLGRPHQSACSKDSERENRRAVTYPPVHDRRKEPDANDHKQRPGKSKRRRLMASIFGRKKADQTTQNHKGQETNVENGKAKGKKKTSRSKSVKKGIIIPTLRQYIMNEGPGRTT